MCRDLPDARFGRNCHNFTSCRQSSVTYDPYIALSAGKVWPLQQAENVRWIATSPFASVRKKEECHEDNSIRYAAFGKCGRLGCPGSGRSHAPDASRVCIPVQRGNGWRLRLRSWPVDDGWRLEGATDDGLG